MRTLYETLTWNAGRLYGMEETIWGGWRILIGSAYFHWILCP